MKKIYLSAFIFFLLIIHSESKAQSSPPIPPNFQELIVQIPVQIDRQFADLKSDILALGGMQYINYCASEQCLMLKVDRNIHANDLDLITLLKGKNLPFEIKVEATIEQAMNQCASAHGPSHGK